MIQSVSMFSPQFLPPDVKRHELLDADRIAWDVGKRAGEAESVGHQNVHAVGVAPSQRAVPGGLAVRRHRFNLIGTTVRNPEPLPQVVFRNVEHAASRIDAYHRIGHFFQIGCDMGREQDAVLPIGNVVKQDVEGFVSGYRVKARRRLVQNKQARLERQGGSQRQLHRHAAGKLLDGLFPRDPKLAQQPVESHGIPGGMHGLTQRIDAAQRKRQRKRAGIGNISHLRHTLPIIDRRSPPIPAFGSGAEQLFAEQGDPPRIGIHQTKKRFDGGRFTGAVGPHQTGHAPRIDAQIDGLELEITEAFLEAPYRNKAFHTFAPSYTAPSVRASIMSCTSDRERPADRADDSAASSCRST